MSDLINEALDFFFDDHRGEDSLTEHFDENHFDSMLDRNNSGVSDDVSFKGSNTPEVCGYIHDIYHSTPDCEAMKPDENFKVVFDKYGKPVSVIDDYHKEYTLSDASYEKKKEGFNYFTYKGGKKVFFKIRFR